MENRIALMGIIVEDENSVSRLNELLHQYAEYVFGRMGLPNRARGVSVISVALDAPTSVVSALSGKIGMLPGVSAKTIFAKASAPSAVSPQ